MIDGPARTNSTYPPTAETAEDLIGSLGQVAAGELVANQIVRAAYLSLPAAVSFWCAVADAVELLP